MDFLHASVMAKIVNVSTNLAAIGFFVSHGEVFWKVAAVMALCNLAGSQVGRRSRCATARPSSARPSWSWWWC
jgi:uncharacterized membrane protein YfcA